MTPGSTPSTSATAAIPVTRSCRQAVQNGGLKLLQDQPWRTDAASSRLARSRRSCSTCLAPGADASDRAVSDAVRSAVALLHGTGEASALLGLGFDRRGSKREAVGGGGSDARERGNWSKRRRLRGAGRTGSAALRGSPHPSKLAVPFSVQRLGRQVPVRSLPRGCPETTLTAGGTDAQGETHPVSAGTVNKMHGCVPEPSPPATLRPWNLRRSSVG